MMKTKYIMACVMLLLAHSGMAQNGSIDDNGGLAGTAGDAQSHVFIQVQGGVQHTLGEAAFADLLSPDVQVAAGWQIKPWMGLRLAVGAWQSKGAVNGYVADGQAGGKSYKYNYVAPAADFMLNMSELIGGHNPYRVANVMAFVGIGANVAFGNDEAIDIDRSGYEMAYLWDGTKVRPVGRAGIGLDIRLSKVVSIGAEVNANVISDWYNSKKAGNADWYFNALAGVKISLGRTVRKEVPQRENIQETVSRDEPVVEQIVEQNIPSDTVRTVQQPEKKVTVRRDIFFRINSFVVSEKEMAKLAELAEYLKANPEAVLHVTGYADAGTGTAEINERLSEKRAKEVVRLMTRKFGIDFGRLIHSHEGSRVQPFDDNDSNRVSICVTEL